MAGSGRPIRVEEVAVMERRVGRERPGFRRQVTLMHDVLPRVGPMQTAVVVAAAAILTARRGSVVECRLLLLDDLLLQQARSFARARLAGPLRRRLLRPGTVGRQRPLRQVVNSVLLLSESRESLLRVLTVRAGHQEDGRLVVESAVARAGHWAQSVDSKQYSFP